MGIFGFVLILFVCIREWTWSRIGFTGDGILCFFFFFNKYLYAWLNYWIYDCLHNIGGIICRFNLCNLCSFPHTKKKGATILFNSPLTSLALLHTLCLFISASLFFALILYWMHFLNGILIIALDYFVFSLLYILSTDVSGRVMEMILLKWNMHEVPFLL